MVTQSTDLPNTFCGRGSLKEERDLECVRVFAMGVQRMDDGILLDGPDGLRTRESSRQTIWEGCANRENTFLDSVVTCQRAVNSLTNRYYYLFLV